MTRLTAWQDRHPTAAPFVLGPLILTAPALLGVVLWGVATLTGIGV